MADAMIAFGVTVGTDFIAALVIDGKSVEDSYGSISWGASNMGCNFNICISIADMIPGSGTAYKTLQSLKN